MFRGKKLSKKGRRNSSRICAFSSEPNILSRWFMIVRLHSVNGTNLLILFSVFLIKQATCALKTHLVFVQVLEAGFYCLFMTNLFFFEREKDDLRSLKSRFDIFLLHNSLQI